MSDKRYIERLSLLLNIFVPGSANIALSDYNPGIVLVLCSQVIFFLIPFLPLLIIKVLYITILIVSYGLLFKRERVLNSSVAPVRTLVIVTLPFITLSVLALSFTHLLMADNSSEDENTVVYVLGTKPFKKGSTERMLGMSEDELIGVFNNNIHPFFRRLKIGLNKIREGQGTLLISAGKNQKKIVQRILDSEKKRGLFLSSRSTKEEIIALKDYITKNDLTQKKIVVVSDDYHAFRALLYSKLNNIENVRFLSTSYKYSFISFIKIYLVEQLLFLISYLSFPIGLFF